MCVNTASFGSVFRPNIRYPEWAHGLCQLVIMMNVRCPTERKSFVQRCDYYPPVDAQVATDVDTYIDIVATVPYYKYRDTLLDSYCIVSSKCSSYHKHYLQLSRNCRQTLQELGWFNAYCLQQKRRNPFCSRASKILSSSQGLNPGPPPAPATTRRHSRHPARGSTGNGDRDYGMMLILHRCETRLRLRWRRERSTGRRMSVKQW